MNENEDKRGEGEERGGERREGGRTAPDDVGQFLSAEDETRVRNFVTEFVAQRLVPHLEAVLKNLNEWVSPSTIAICTIFNRIALHSVGPCTFITKYGNGST